LGDPEVLLLDEPTASLDAQATHEILKILEGWKGRKAVVLASHRIEEIKPLTNRLVEIRGGKLLEENRDAFGPSDSVVDVS
jgi:energy-coupling factor transporter ATP-binding protein EcfA2